MFGIDGLAQKIQVGLWGVVVALVVLTGFNMYTLHEIKSENKQSRYFQALILDQQLEANFPNEYNSRWDADVARAKADTTKKFGPVPFDLKITD